MVPAFCPTPFVTLILGFGITLFPPQIPSVFWSGSTNSSGRKPFLRSKEDTPQRLDFAELFRPSGECVGILGENHRALFDIRLGEDFEVVADDMSIRRIGGGEAFDHFVIVRRTNRMTKIEREDVEMLQRKIARQLPHLELRYDQGGEAKKMASRHTVPEVIHSS